MPGIELTAKRVEKLRPRPGRTREIYFDRAKGSPPGFALRVHETGRTYYLVYRFGPAGKKRWWSLGDADAMPLAEARAKARAGRDLLHHGIDPKDDEDRAGRERAAAAEHQRRTEIAESARPTLAGLVDRFVDAHRNKYRAGTLAEYRRIQQVYVAASPLGSLMATDVRRYQVRAFLEGIARRAPVMANRVQQVVRAAYAWGIREELDEQLEANPAAGFDVHDERPMSAEERTLSAPEIKRLWVGVDAIDDAGQRRLPLEAAAYLKLLLLCGLRRTEAARADWRDVNLKAREWRIPAANRKGAGRRGKAAIERELIVPLSSTARALLQELGPGSGPVFPTVAAVMRGRPYNFTQRAREVIGCEFGLHDLRATCATGAGEAGAAPHVVSLILGHAVLPGAAQATRLYDRATRLREVKDALERWAERVERIAASEDGDLIAFARESSAQS